MSFNDEIRDEKDSEELSGRPLVAESVKLDDHIQSNSKICLFLPGLTGFSFLKTIFVV